MNWSRASAYLMTGEHGYKVAKFLVGDQAQYRASLGGRFLGQVQESADDACQVCESHFQIMGAEESEEVASDE